MTSTAPSPPVPPDADLRHMPGYMIDVQSLLGSDLAALGDPAANWYAVLTWCAAFHQVPAGSLPDDDPVLAYLVRLGRDVRTWKKMREKGAMRGWVKHSDGRLYHPVVTEAVLKLLGKSKAGKTAAGAKQARKNSQAIENATAGINDGSTNAASSLQQSDNKGKERKGREGKGIGEQDLLGLAAEPSLQSPPVPAVRKPTKRPRQEKIPIPPDWSAVGEDWQYATERGFTPQNIPIEEEKFRLHFLKTGEKRPGWSLSWKSWIVKAIEFKAERATRNGSAPATRPNRAETAAMGMLSDLTEEDFHGRSR